MTDRFSFDWEDLLAYRGEIYGYIKNMVADGETARDLQHDVFLAAWKALQQKADIRSLKSWLYTLARNRSLNYLRDQRPVQTGALPDLKIAEQRTSRHLVEFAGTVIDRLPQRQRDILRLKEIDGLSHREIAVETGLSREAVNSLLARARENYRRAFVEESLRPGHEQIFSEIPLDDLLRFFNPFDPPLDLLKRIESGTVDYFSRRNREWTLRRAHFTSEKELRAIIEVAGIRRGQMVADFGSGTAELAGLLAMLGTKVFAVDFKMPPVEIRDQFSTGTGRRPVHLIRANVRNVPFKSNRLDHVFLVLVLHHLPDPVHCLEQAIKCLKPGGRLILIDFVRHKHKDMADEMHDLWLGFDPAVFRRRLKKHAGLIWEELLGEKKKLVVFCQIWERHLQG